MEENESFKEKQRRILYGIHLAQKRLFEERALHGQTIVVGDKNGNPITIKAADYLAQHKEFFDKIK